LERLGPELERTGNDLEDYRNDLEIPGMTWRDLWCDLWQPFEGMHDLHGHANLHGHAQPCTGMHNPAWACMALHRQHNPTQL